MLKDYLKITLGSLRRRLLRTALTMLGIFIGIATVVALVSLGQGLEDAINAQFANVGADKIIIQGASVGFGPPGQDLAGTVGTHDEKLISHISGIKLVTGRLLRSVTAEFNNKAIVFFSATIPEETSARKLVIEANSIEVEDGRMLRSDDQKKILVGKGLWQADRFDKQLRLGDMLLLNGERFEIIGFLKAVGAGRDDAIYLNEQDARDLFNEKDALSALIAQVNPGEDPAAIADRIFRTMRRDRGQKEGFEDFTVSTSADVIATINTVLGVIQAVFIGIAAISLFVGGIGIMNTMYTSVLERTREIGIMKAIGGKNRDVLILFLLESGILGLFGGTIGIFLGAGLSKLVEIGARNAIGNLLRASFPPTLIIGALLFSFLIGIISGVFPARQASRLPPVEALRA